MKITMDDYNDCLGALAEGLTKRYLNSVPDDRVFGEICDYYYGNIDIRGREYHDEKLGRTYFVPDERCLLLLIKEVDDQVFNGGFNQYMFNRGQNAGYACIALEDVCGDKYAKILEDVMEAFSKKPNVYEKARRAETREEVLKQFSATYDVLKLDGYDKQWSELAEEREKLIVKYIREHLDQLVHENPNLEESPPSPLDVYFDSDELERQLANDCPDWNPSDVSGSRTAFLQNLLKHMQRLYDEGDYAGAEYIMSEKIAEQTERWNMAESDVFMQSMKLHVSVLAKGHRRQQAEALQNLLNSADSPV